MRFAHEYHNAEPILVPAVTAHMEDKSLVPSNPKFVDLLARLLRLEWAERKMQTVMDLGNSLRQAHAKMAVALGP
jgi:hypothetical protein